MSLSLQDNLTGLCYSILQGISHTFNINEITDVRLLHANTITEVHTQSSENAETTTIYPSLIVRLSTISRVKQILTLKREVNYYNTKDLELTHLGEDFVTRVPATKLIINEVLSSSEYQKFKTLRKDAKNIGFKYVWHTNGKFLTRWNNSGRVHFFNSLIDIDTIKTKCNYNIIDNFTPGDKTSKTTK